MAAAGYDQQAGLQQMETDGQRPVKIISVSNVACAAVLAASLIGLVSLSDAAETTGRAPATATVSVPELLANKAKYKDKIVRVAGYITVAMEDNTIFANEEESDLLYGDPKAGIWLSLSQGQYRDSKRFSHKNGHVTGRFKTSDCEGHLCLFGGSLEVLRISP